MINVLSDITENVLTSQCTSQEITDPINYNPYRAVQKHRHKLKETKPFRSNFVSGI